MLDEAQQGLPWHNYFHRLPFPVYIGQFATPYPSTEFAAQVRENSLVVLDDDEDLFHHQINTIPNSLLDDVPVRTMDGPLSRDHLTILLLGTEAALYREFSLEESRRERNRRLAVAGRTYCKFWTRVRRGPPPCARSPRSWRSRRISLRTAATATPRSPPTYSARSARCGLPRTTATCPWSPSRSRFRSPHVSTFAPRCGPL